MCYGIFLEEKIMKKILCFGDSNIFGFIPESGKRYPKNIRWTGILQGLVQNDFEVIEAGCNNRTAFADNPCGNLQTGYKAIPPLLTKDLDCIILAIGINDLQFSYNQSLEQIQDGIEKLIGIAQEKCPDAKMILVSPSVLTEDVLKSGFSAMFDETSIEKSKHLSAIYKNVADKTGCFFIDINSVAKVSSLDGLHYSATEHKKIAHKMFKILSLLFKDF